MALAILDYSIPVIAVVLALVLFRLVSRGGKGQPLHPPGPQGLPFIGNVFGFPTTKPWIAYAEWGRKYHSETISYCIGLDVSLIAYCSV